MVLGDGSTTLVPLTASQLTDGPWCPTTRTRIATTRTSCGSGKSAVTLSRSGLTSLRARPGPLLAWRHPGRGSLAAGSEIRLDVAPRNLNAGR
jgi:hypothetical protein